MKLVIIEGIGKRDTIGKYLGSDYEVVATNGHIRDLPVKTLGVNIQGNFEPDYQIIPDKKDIVKKLKDKSAKAEKIFLATDPDREGEAISWHLAHILGLDVKDNIRIVFNEISKNAVNQGVNNPRPIDENLVDAQQARRILDRLVGYKISPIICKKIQPKLSAGRVQSVALKLVVDREKEIKAFVPKEFWSLAAIMNKPSASEQFKSVIFKINNKKAVIENQEQMDRILSDLTQNNYIVSDVKKTVGKTRPTPPYTTSTMQQDALNKLGFDLKRATRCAQELYEGVDLGSQGKTALVTYIRTDSVRTSPEAVKMARDFITNNFGNDYLPSSPNLYKTKKSAQDAHEAIRPINLDVTPQSIKDLVSSDNYKLYNMIYNKFLASQMVECKYDMTTILIDNGDYQFKATGKVITFDGFTKLYQTSAKKAKKEQTDEEKEASEESDENDSLPLLNVGEQLIATKLDYKQKFTKPQARYTEASLVKEMEEKGIGRPATYTPTITILSSRRYIEKEGRYLKPTELGEKIDELVGKYFKDIINVEFTANMEDQLDEIAHNGDDWSKMVSDFYTDFAKLLESADKDSVKFKIPPKPTDILCDKCNSPMVIRTGRYGEFLACSNFPACKNIQNLNKPKEVGICPKCGNPILEKKSKKGSIFYGCSKFPECDYVSWEIPLEEKCPNCNSNMTGKNYYGKMKKSCVQCGYTVIEDKGKDEQK